MRFLPTRFTAGVLTALSAMCLMAAPAIAQGINLGWDDCRAGAFAIDKTDACNANTGTPHKMVLSIELAADLDNINGAQGVIDVQLDNTPLNDFWALPSGGCRAGRLSAQVDIGSASAPFTCIEAWSQVGNAAGAANWALPTNPSHGPNWGRITWILGVPGEVTFNAADGEHYVVALNLTRSATTTCAGCNVPACIVANEARFTRPAQDPRGDVFVYSAGSGQHVTWQGGGSLACPASTPTSNTTWGQVKHLYR